MRVKASRPIQYVLSNGERVDLVPGQWIDIPGAAAHRLFAKAPAYVQLLEDGMPEPAIDPDLAEPPVKPGYFIAFFDEGRYYGGSQGGDAGLVVRVLFDGLHWNHFTAGGWQIQGDQVHRVQPVDPRTGFLGDSWSVKERGLDGRGYCYAVTTARLARAGVRVEAVDPRFSEPLDPKPIADTGVVCLAPEAAGARLRLHEVSAAQRAQLVTAYHLTADEFTALATGAWTPDTWTRFWTTPGLAVSAPKTPRPSRRTTLTVDCHGTPHTIQAWCLEFLAVHRSVAAPGWTVSHVGTGAKVLSRIASKDEAFRLVDRLVSALEWTVATLSPADLARIGSLFAQVSRSPLRAPLRDPFTLPPRKEAEMDG